MKSFISIVCGVMLAVFVAPALASAQDVHGKDSKKIEVHLLDALVFGATTLQPGDYHFQCRIIDGQHYLVATTVVGDEEVARTPCTPAALDAQVKKSEFRTAHRDGVNVLTSVRFKGDTSAHTVAVQ